jgi:tRNA/tmRNA/rRNA uracil-C5-methylase (TrmA/RlmC/RlmD family)
MVQHTDVTHAIEIVDRMIDEVSDAAESQCELLREHLESARASRLGEMMEEYQLNLGLAKENTGCITDPPRRGRVEEALRALIAETVRS